MSENQKKILQMLADGKISVEEATRLLYLVGERPAEGAEDSKNTGRPSAKYLYIRVEPKERAPRIGTRQGKHTRPGWIHPRRHETKVVNSITRR